MQTYLVTIRGNDGFYREHAGQAKSFTDAYMIALGCLKSDQRTTIELLRITCIKEQPVNQQEP